jgi:hypothetical protein
VFDGGDEVGSDDDDDDDNGDGGDDDDGGLTRVDNETASCDVAEATSEVRPTDVAAGRPRAMEHLFSCLCWARPALLKNRLEQATHSMASAASECLSRLWRTRASGRDNTWPHPG